MSDIQANVFVAGALPTGGVSPAEFVAQVDVLTAADTLRNQYSTRVYADRATAVADIAKLTPGQTTRIITVEGQALCVRAPFQNGDDPLSATSPYWGVVLRQDVAAEATARAQAIAALQYEMRDGRIWIGYGGVTPSGIAVPAWADAVQMIHNASGSTKKWRPVGAPSDGLETESTVQDGADPVRWWTTVSDPTYQDRSTHTGSQPISSIDGLSAELSGLRGADATETSARISADNAIGVVPLSNVSGLDEITAEIPASLAALGVAVIGGAFVSLVPVGDNSGPAFLTVGSDVRREILNEAGASLAGRELIGGRTAFVERRAGRWRLISSAGMVDVLAERLNRIIGLSQMGTVLLSGVTLTDNAMAAAMPVELTSIGVSAANLRRVRWQWPAATNTGATTLDVAGQGAVSLRDPAGAVLTDGFGVPGRFYEAVKNGPNWWIVSGDVIRSDLMNEASTLLALFRDLRARLDLPMEVIDKEGSVWTEFDRNGRAIGGWDATGRIGVLSDRTLANAGPRLLGGDTEATVQSRETRTARVLEADANGNPVKLWRSGANGGFDMPMCQEFWDRGWERMGGGDAVGGIDQHYLTSTIILTQSLWFMDGNPGVSPTYPGVDADVALMLGGLKRSDGVDAGLAGARTLSYDTSAHSTGLVPVDPVSNNPTGAYYAAKGYNQWRTQFGLIRRRSVNVLWGQPGDHITRYNNILGDAPGGFVDETRHWSNLMFYLDELKRVAAEQNLIVRIDMPVTQGTSSKSDSDPLLHARTLRRLIVDLRAEFDARGFEDATVYFTQPGGDADTSDSQEHWHVTQSYLDLAEEGYGVLVSPESYVGIWDNNVHWGEAEGERLMGMINWARAAREAGRAFTIGRPTVTRDGLTVTLDYTTLWDGEMWEVEPDRYAGQGIDAYHGYTCDTATITGIELLGRKVRLEFDAVPLWIDYMMQSQDVRGLNDGYTAFRGRMVTTTRMRDPLNPTIVHRRRMPSHGVAVPQ